MITCYYIDILTFFCFSLENQRENKSEKYRRGKSRRYRAHAALHRAQDSFFLNAFYRAFCKVGAEPRDGHGDSCLREFFDIVKRARNFQHYAKHQKRDEYSCRRHFRSVYQHLPEHTYEATHGKHFKISQKYFHFTPRLKPRARCRVSTVFAEGYLCSEVRPSAQAKVF